MEGKYCHYYYLSPAPFKAVPVVKAVHGLKEGSGAFFFYLWSMIRKKIDTRNWKRKEIYEFFKDYEEPYYGITVELECTGALNFAREKGISFFLYYLYLTLKAVNQAEAFKYRMEGDDVFLYDDIDGRGTIDRDDGTFGFSHIPYFEDLDLFMERATEEVIDVRTSNRLIRSEIGENVIHFSALPWIGFSHVSHPRRYARRDSIPKITIGKYRKDGEKYMIPVSVHVNHAVADGLHVGMFFDTLQELFSSS